MGAAGSHSRAKSKNSRLWTPSSNQEANGEILNVEAEANRGGLQETPPLFKHRDVLVFDENSCAAYRPENVDGLMKHDGTHRTSFFDFKGPRARHRADFLRELDEERERSDTQSHQDRHDLHAHGYQSISVEAAERILHQISQSGSAIVSTGSFDSRASRAEKKKPHDLVMEFSGTWAQRAEVHVPHRITISTERKAEAPALRWAQAGELDSIRPGTLH